MRTSSHQKWREKKENIQIWSGEDKSAMFALLKHCRWELITQNYYRAGNAIGLYKQTSKLLNFLLLYISEKRVEWEESKTESINRNGIDLCEADERAKRKRGVLAVNGILVDHRNRQFQILSDQKYTTFRISSINLPSVPPTASSHQRINFNLFHTIILMLL
jgi:hypothetical protein